MKNRYSWMGALLLMVASAGALADGRPSGLRISNVVLERDGLVRMDVTVPYASVGYLVQYPAPGQTGGNYTAFLGNQVSLGAPGTFQYQANQYYSATQTVPRPYAIDWGDGDRLSGTVLTGPSNGPYTGTFSHTYASPGDYIIRVADAVCCGSLTVTTGYVVFDTIRYLFDVIPGSGLTFSNTTSAVSIANTTLVEPLFQTPIPALDAYGLLALALVLMGIGMLLVRRRSPA